MRPRSLAFLLLLAVPLGGCDSVQKLFGDSKASKTSDDDDDDDKPRKKKKKEADAIDSASAAASASAPPVASAEVPEGFGAMVSVDAGTLKAGASCGAVPRITNEELAHVPINLGAFEIDVLPYPNEAGQPPRTGVSRTEAAELCAARGKRLCSELEWERACKGPENHTFSYGNGYDKTACPDLATSKTGERSKCKSPYGMVDPHGLALEWTASSWARGSGGGLATVRGFKGSNNVVRDRCASGQGRAPDKSFSDVGFRCCRGSENTREVDLTLLRRPVISEDARVDPDLASDLMRAMPTDHQQIAGFSVSFDRIWRWHPRDNEELVIGRWIARKPLVRTAHELAVFKICGGIATRVARMRGPVEKLERIVEDKTPEKLRIDVSTDADSSPLTLTYWYGAVAINEPAWIKTANTLPETDKKRIPRVPILKLPKRK